MFTDRVELKNCKHCLSSRLRFPPPPFSTDCSFIVWHTYKWYLFNRNEGNRFINREQHKAVTVLGELFLFVFPESWSMKFHKHKMSKIMVHEISYTSVHPKSWSMKFHEIVHPKSWSMKFHEMQFYSYKFLNLRIIVLAHGLEVWTCSVLFGFCYVKRLFFWSNYININVAIKYQTWSRI